MTETLDKWEQFKECESHVPGCTCTLCERLREFAEEHEQPAWTRFTDPED